jgi:hypothetical protein
MNDPIEHATGIEKREILAKQAGREVWVKNFVYCSM